jgi:hypothetical protein
VCWMSPSDARICLYKKTDNGAERIVMTSASLKSMINNKKPAHL